MNRRPSWVTPWGVIAIVVGAYGIFSGAGASVMPRMLKMQREMMDTAFSAQAAREAEVPADDAETRKRARDAEAMKKMSGEMLKMFELTPAQERWIVVSGAIGAVLSGLYILAAAFVLQLRALGVKLFVGAAGAKIALALGGIVFVTAPAGFGAWMVVPGALMGIVAHGVMLAILLVNARDLEPRSEPPVIGALG
jgi:hypothetical protein